MSNYWDNILGTQTQTAEEVKTQKTQNSESYWDDFLGTKTVQTEFAESQTGSKQRFEPTGETEEKQTLKVGGSLAGVKTNNEIHYNFKDENKKGIPQWQFDAMTPEKQEEFKSLGGLIKQEQTTEEIQKEEKERLQRQAERWQGFKILGEQKREKTANQNQSIFNALLSGIKSGTTGVVSSIGSAAESVGYSEDIDWLQSWGEKIADKYQGIIIANPQWQPQGEGKYSNPNWWTQKTGELIPFVLGTLGVATVGTLTTGPIGGGAATYAFMSSTEAGNAYQTYRQEGLSIDDAAKASQAYGAVAGALESITPSILMKTIGRPLGQSVAKSFLNGIMKKVPKIVLTEGGTEGLQQFTQNYVLSWYKDNVDLFEGVLESTALGAVGGLVFSGVGSTLHMIPSAKTALQEESKIASQNPTKENISVIEESRQDIKDSTIPFVSNEDFNVKIIPFDNGTFQSQGEIKVGSTIFTSPPNQTFQTYQEAIATQVQELKSYLSEKLSSDKNTKELINLSNLEKQLEEISTTEKINKYVDQKIKESKQNQQNFVETNVKTPKIEKIKTDESWLEKQNSEEEIKSKEQKKEKPLSLNDIKPLKRENYKTEEDFQKARLKKLEEIEAVWNNLAEKQEKQTKKIAKKQGGSFDTGPEGMSWKEYFDSSKNDNERTKRVDEFDKWRAEEYKKEQKEKRKKEKQKKPKDEKVYASGAKPRIKKDSKPQKTSIENTISFKDDEVSIKEKVKDSAERFYIAMKDEMYAIKKVFGEDSKVMQKVRNFAGAAKRAEEMLVGEGTFNYGDFATNGESLRNIVKDISKEKERDLEFYLLLRREKALQEVKPDYKTTLDLEEVKTKITELEQKYSDIKKLGDRIRNFNDRVFQYAVDSGFISEDVAKAVRKENPDYTAPMFRDVKQLKKGVASGAIAKVSNPIKRISGTLKPDLKTLPPLENIIKNTYHILDAVNKNDIKRDIVQSIETNKEFEKFVKLTKPKVIPVGESVYTAVYDKEFESKLINFAKKLGLREFQKKGKVGSNLGYYRPAGEFINRKIGTGRETTAHEVGHFLDNKYGLKEKFYRQKLTKAVGDEIYQHSIKKGETGKRLGMVAERFANAFSWWLSQRYLAQRDLPKFSKVMEQIIKENPELKELLEIEPTPRNSLESDVETVFAIAPRQPDGVIDVKIDGETKYYEVDLDIYKALMGLDRQQTNIIVKILEVPTKWLRAGATLTPEFTLRNPFRDQLTAAINSNNGYIPFVDLARGVYKMISKKPSNIELNRLYRISGADYGSIVSPDRAEMEQALRDVIQGRDATYYVKHPIDFLRLIAEYGETGTRLAEFEKQFKKQGGGKDSVYAAGAAARDLTLNFGKMGTQGKILNKIIAFFNAQLEDIDKMFRQHKKYPAKTVLKAVSYVTIPTILLWFLNRGNDDYEELSQWRKDLFWNIPIGGKKIKFIAIPKPFGYGTIYGTFTEKILNTMDKGNLKEGFDGFGGVLFRSFAPSIAPTALVPVVENKFNYSMFLDRPLVSANKEDLIPELQYGRYTAESAKFLGETFGYSPAKIENLIRGYTGGLGGYGLQAGDKLVGAFTDLPEKPDRGLSGFPVLKAFLVDKPLGSRANSVNEFYDISLESSTALDSYNEIKNSNPDKAEQYLKENSQYIALAKRIASMRQGLSGMYKQRDIVLDSKKLNGKQKAKQLDEIDTQILDMSKGFLKEIKEFNDLSPQQAKVMSFSQTDKEGMAKEFLKLSDKEQEVVLKLFTKNRKSALQKGKEDILLKKYVTKKGLSSRLANELVKEAIGKTDDASSKQRATNLKKEFSIYREFGFENDLVNSLMSASTNSDRAELLKTEKEKIGQIKFSSFVTKARKMGLVSDDTYKKYLKLK